VECMLLMISTTTIRVAYTNHQFRLQELTTQFLLLDGVTMQQLEIIGSSRIPGELGGENLDTLESPWDKETSELVLTHATGQFLLRPNHKVQHLI